eukprot:365554-Chlamydomonas_euryale.AAC.17
MGDGLATCRWGWAGRGSSFTPRNDAVVRPRVRLAHARRVVRVAAVGTLSAAGAAAPAAGPYAAGVRRAPPPTPRTRRCISSPLHRFAQRPSCLPCQRTALLSRP